MTKLPQRVPRALEIAPPTGSARALHSAIRKTVLRLVPLLAIACLFNYLDLPDSGATARYRTVAIKHHSFVAARRDAKSSRTPMERPPGGEPRRDAMPSYGNAMPAH